MWSEWWRAKKDEPTLLKVLELIAVDNPASISVHAKLTSVRPTEHTNGLVEEL